MTIGALAGVAGTMVLQTVRKISQKYVSETAEPPMKEHPGTFMVHQAERLLPETAKAKVSEKVSEETKAKIGEYLGLAYGATFGALYGALRPQGGPTMLDGAWFGLLTWAAGYLGWLPASGLMPPVWKHEAKQVSKPIAEHALFGVATVAAYDLMTNRLQPRHIRRLKRWTRRSGETLKSTAKELGHRAWEMATEAA